MNNTLESSLAACRSANKSYQATFRAKKCKEKKQEEEEKKQQEEKDFKRDECSEFPQFYERPVPDEDKKKQGERRTRVRKNMKAERRALKVERDLKEESVNLQCPDLYQERLSGENSKEQRARRWKIRRGLDAVKAASNEMVVDQVVEEAMGQPGQFEGTLNRPNRSNPHLTKDWMLPPSAAFKKTVASASMILSKTAWLLKLRIITSVLCRFALHSGSVSWRTWVRFTRRE